MTNSGTCGKEVGPRIEEELARRQVVPLCLLHAAKYFLNSALGALLDLEIAHRELRGVAEAPAWDYIRYAAVCLEALEEQATAEQGRSQENDNVYSEDG